MPCHGPIGSDLASMGHRALFGDRSCDSAEDRSGRSEFCSGTLQAQPVSAGDLWPCFYDRILLGGGETISRKSVTEDFRILRQTSDVSHHDTNGQICCFS